MDVQHLGERAGGDAREPSDDADHQPLRAGDAEARLHPLGDGLQAVIHRP